MREKRQHFRERLLKPIQVHVAPPGGKSEVAYAAHVVDLSLSGALLSCSVAIPPGSAIELDLPIEGQGEMRVQAEVIRCHPQDETRFAVAVHFAKQLEEAAVILARNILFTYKSVIHSHMN
jgi:hypothetical protein